MAVLGLVAVQPAHAGTVYWDEGGLDKSWNTATNWSDDTLPSNANEYVLDDAHGATMTTSYGLDADFTIQTLTLNSAAMTDLNANASATDARVLTLNGGTANPLIKVGTSANAAVNIGVAGSVGTLAIKLGGSGDIDVAGTKTLTINSAIGESGGNRNLTKTGDGALILTGAGSGINYPAGNMTVSGGSMTISGGGTLWSEYGNIGNTGKNNITVTVTGAGSNWSIGDALNVGNGGTGNTLIVSDHASMWSYFGYFSSPAGSSDNTITVTGTGSTWTIYDVFVLLDHGTGSKLEILNGGTVNANQGGSKTYIAQSSGADNNSVLVDGGGSVWNTREVDFSTSGKNNTITISNGGKMNNAGWDFYVKSTGNVVNVYSGGELTTNALMLVGADAALNLGDGTSISTASVQKVKLEAAGSRLNFNNGRLTARQTTTELVYSAGQVNLIGPAYINSAGFNVTIDRVITGGGSLTKEGTGTLTLTGANTYTGDTTVSEGTLEVTSAFFDDASTVNIDSGFLKLSHLATDTISYFYLAGTQQPAGTYDATNTPTYLSGTGSLKVLLPEPATMALLGLGGLGLLLNRKRR